MNSRKYAVNIMAVLMMLFLSAASVSAQDLPQPSPRATVSQVVGLTDISLIYSRPGVKGRVIWGGLVPYNKMWRTGANAATTISFSDGVKINGQNLPAGTYSLFTIPAESQWTVIFNKNSKLSGTSGYDEKEDALRIQVKPQAAEFEERMSFSFMNLQDNSATVALRWEKLAVPFTVEVETHAKAMANIKEAMANVKADDYSTPFRCANYYFNNDMNTEEAMKWANQSVSIKETYFNTALQARLLAKTGKHKEAIAAAEKSLQLAKENDVNMSELEAEVAEWKKAL